MVYMDYNALYGLPVGNPLGPECGKNINTNNIIISNNINRSKKVRLQYNDVSTTTRKRTTTLKTATTIPASETSVTKLINFHKPGEAEK